MILLLETYNDYTWLAPYGYSVVLLGFSIYLFRLIENLYANIFQKPLFRNYFIYKKLSAFQLKVLNCEFSFYKTLSKKHQGQFQHRLVCFMSEKEFIGRDGVQVNERMKVLISAIACMLSFGRKNYSFALIEYIIIYPKEFYSKVNNAYHKGEFNPKQRVLVLSWDDFENGLQITYDNRNLGIHEFMHAMQLEAKMSSDSDSDRFQHQFQNILKQLTKPVIKEKLISTRYFRDYAFTNQYEFMAVITEYFIESPKEFKSQFPELYGYTKTLLNFNFVGY